jgi:hypothetical protein
MCWLAGQTEAEFAAYLKQVARNKPELLQKLREQFVAIASHLLQVSCELCLCLPSKPRTGVSELFNARFLELSLSGLLKSGNRRRIMEKTWKLIPQLSPMRSSMTLLQVSCELCLCLPSKPRTGVSELFNARFLETLAGLGVNSLSLSGLLKSGNRRRIMEKTWKLIPQLSPMRSSCLQGIGSTCARYARWGRQGRKQGQVAQRPQGRASQDPRRRTRLPVYPTHDRTL